jgi:hypothetical protein
MIFLRAEPRRRRGDVPRFLDAEVFLRFLRRTKQTAQAQVRLWRRRFRFFPGFRVASQNIQPSYPCRKSVILLPFTVFVKISPASGSPFRCGIFSHGCFHAPVRLDRPGMMYVFSGSRPMS